ncbi:hypothetical protein [Candidatus Nanosynbacter lyticus]|jgi:hypothetical protein|nr:hypothetical protein [Candidatus Nanosynbacter lyticus]QHU92417.1 hypothetical protein GWK76_03840 [Candidatus Saccharibacteria bacterium oral taxon 488]WLD47118.1 hypothetical protein NLML1_0763 [Candidatus Nanosynbacter lyticus]
MAEWIGGLLSGLPTWLVVIILIIIFMAMVVSFPCTYGDEPFWPFRRRKK